MKKITKILICLICVALLSSLFVACGGDSAPTFEVKVESVQNGSFEVSKQKAKAGENITVTPKPNDGFMVESITMNGDLLEIVENKAVFQMPSEDAVISGSFVADPTKPVVENMPTLRAFDIEAVSVRTPAQGGWVFAFSESSLDITVWVKDAHLFPDADGIKTYFGKAGYDRELGENNLLIHLLANGEMKAYKVVNGTFEQEEVGGIVGFVQQWCELSADSISGYKFTLKVSYETLGVTKDNAKGLITMLPSHTNQNMDTNPAKESLLEGDYKIEKPQTYPLLTGDNEYEENPMASTSAQLGSALNLDVGAYWNTEKDYFEDESQYENRVVTLSGNDNADNDIFFHKTAGSKYMYAEATFKVTNVYSNEKYGKFGLMLFNGFSNNGFFFYVDAFIGEQTANVDNIVGTELGYNQALSGWGAWTNIADTQGSFDLENKTITLKMAYNDGKLYLYCGDTLIMARNYATGSQRVIGIKSFGYGLEVTSYYSSNSADDPKFIAHTPEDTAREVGVVFVGDNRMANWSGYQTLNIEKGKAKDAIANETVTSLSQKVLSLKDFYKPDNIVISVGMREIHSGNDALMIANHLEILFARYHSAFPQTKLYWVSVISTPAHQSKLSQITALNQLVSEMAQTDAMLEYVDVVDLFSVDGKPRANLFADNGVELNLEFGYALWTKAMSDALGLERAQGSQFGDNREGYGYSGGWTFDENGTAINNGTGEQAIWYQNLTYSSDLYVEAQIYAPKNTGTDAYPKAGLVLRNDNFTIFAYVDLAGNASNGTRFMNIVYRPNKTVSTYEVSGDWRWDAQGNGGYGASISEQFVKLAIAKLDNVVYMLANDEIVATFEVPGMESDDEFIVGAINFNRYMEIKEGYDMTDRVQIANKLGVEIIPEVSLEGATDLGGSGSAHDTTNLTYTVSEYSKTFAVDSLPSYARIYAQKTGAYVITINGNEVSELPTVMKKNEVITYVHDIVKYLVEGDNTVKILTADQSTKVKAKVVFGAENERVIATDSSWVLSSKEVTLSQKPTYYFLGSSVTFGSATNGISFVENVASTLGYNVVKEAVSGTTLVDKDNSSYVSRMKTMSTENAVNRLIVQLSTNDVSQNLNFGTLSESYEMADFNTLTVIGAIEYIIAYAKQTWDCEVVFYTNHKYNSDRYNALINELYKVQAKWGIGIVDFFNYKDMQTLDSDTLNSYKADDIHPNVQGYVWMGEVFSEYIQNSLEQDVIRKAISN